tara:strand:+ start:194 stop:655 length:462 start_codon:yes stop_codon:yes gene_type:complete
MVKIATQAGDGAIAFAQESVVITCSEAVAKGDVMVLTLAAGKFSAARQHNQADSTPNLLLGIASDAVSSGAKGRIVLRGVVEAKCEDTADAGIALVGSATTDGRLEAQGTNPADNGGAFEKVVGVALEDTATSGDLTSVLFDGINGFSSPGNV